MASSPAFTYDREDNLVPTYLGTADSYYLSRLGLNKMVTQFLAIPGTSDNPGQSFQGNEKTGWYNPSLEIVGLSICGYPSILFGYNSISLISKENGFSVKLVGTQTANRNINVPDADGTLALTSDLSVGLNLPLSNAEPSVSLVPGMPVYLFGSGSAKRAQANAYATAKVVGLCTTTTAPAATANIQVAGLLTLTTSEWDAIAGSSGGLTPDTVYYLSLSVGAITTIPPSSRGVGQQSLRIGYAISAIGMLIQFEGPYQL